MDEKVELDEIDVFGCTKVRGQQDKCGGGGLWSGPSPHVFQAGQAQSRDDCVTSCRSRGRSQRSAPVLPPPECCHRSRGVQVLAAHRPGPQFSLVSQGPHCSAVALAQWTDQLVAAHGANSLAGWGGDHAGWLEHLGEEVLQPGDFLLCGQTVNTDLTFGQTSGPDWPQMGKFWNLIGKTHAFVPFGANLTHFDPKSGHPESDSDHG